MAKVGDIVTFYDGQQEVAAIVTAVDKAATDQTVNLTAFNADGSVSGHGSVQHVSALRKDEGDDLSGTHTPHYRLAHELSAL